MSIASLADTHLQRVEAKNPSVNEPKTKAGVPAGILNSLALWIPTETLAGYVAIQAAMDNVVVEPQQRLCDADFGDRWILFWIMLAFSVALVPIYAKIKSSSSSTAFRWPFFQMLIAAAAFSLWALALEDTAFNDWCELKGWHSITALVVGGGLLAGLTAVLRVSPPWSEAADNNAPPSPQVR
jgi:hypothetical protein